MFRRLAAALVVFLLCAELSAQEQKFTPAPPPSAEETLLYVYRQNTPPLAWRAELSLNGVKAVELPTKSYSHVYVKPGEYVVKLGFPFLAGIRAVDGKISFAAGQTYFLRAGGDVSLDTGINARGRTGLVIVVTNGLARVDSDTAKEELPALTFAKPAVERIE